MTGFIVGVLAVLGIIAWIVVPPLWRMWKQGAPTG